MNIVKSQNNEQSKFHLLINFLYDHIHLQLDQKDENGIEFIVHDSLLAGDTSYVCGALIFDVR